jgi:hypothetical protein
LSATDTDGTIASYTVSTLPANGTLALGGVAVTAGQVITPAQTYYVLFDQMEPSRNNDFHLYRYRQYRAVDASQQYLPFQW